MNRNPQKPPGTGRMRAAKKKSSGREAVGKQHKFARRNGGYRVWVLNQMIDQAIGSKDKMEALCLWVLLKVHASHGEYTTMSGAFAQLPTSVKHKELRYGRFVKLFNVLLENNYVARIGHKQYRLVNRNDLSLLFNSHKCNTVVVRFTDGITQVRRSLRLKIMEDFAEQQMHVIHESSHADKDKKNSARLTSRGKKNQEKNGGSDKNARTNDPETSQRCETGSLSHALQNPLFTDKWLAEKLQTSPSEIARIRKQAISRNQISSKPVFEKLMPCRNYEEAKKHIPYLAEKYGHAFYKRGFIWRTVGSSFRAKSYWVTPYKSKNRKPKAPKKKENRSFGFLKVVGKVAIEILNGEYIAKGVDCLYKDYAGYIEGACGGSTGRMSTSLSKR